MILDLLAFSLGLALALLLIVTLAETLGAVDRLAIRRAIEPRGPRVRAACVHAVLHLSVSLTVFVGAASVLAGLATIG